MWCALLIISYKLFNGVPDICYGGGKSSEAEETLMQSCPPLILKGSDKEVGGCR